MATFWRYKRANKALEAYRNASKRSILGTPERTGAINNPCSQFCIHPIQFVIFPKRLSLPYPDEEILSSVRDSICAVHSCIFPKRLFLPHPDEEILSGYEEDVSSIRDGFSDWVKADPASFLKRRLVNTKSANHAFREAPDLKHAPSNEEYRFDTEVPNRLTEQKRLSIYRWNPGPRRRKGAAIEKHIAWKWHIITLQEANKYFYNEFLTNRFCTTHYGGCAIPFK